MPLRRLMVALPKSPSAGPILGRALQLATQHRARLRFVHVEEDAAGGDPAAAGRAGAGIRPQKAAPDTPGVPDLSDPLFGALQPIASFLTNFLTKETTASLRAFRQQQQPAVDSLLLRGKAGAAIVAAAGEWDADLVLLGPGEEKTLRARLLGSTVDHVLRGSARPILVVRNPDPAPWRRVLAGTDFSPHARKAAEEAAMLAPRASFTLLHCIEAPLHFDAVQLQGGASASEVERYGKERIDHAFRQLRGERRGVLGGARLRLVLGKADEALVRLARGRGSTADGARNGAGFDLVAIGRMGESAFRNRISALGRISRTLLRLAGCDVLVV